MRRPNVSSLGADMAVSCEVGWEKMMVEGVQLRVEGTRSEVKVKRRAGSYT
jgi:hypothetical protein